MKSGSAIVLIRKCSCATLRYARNYVGRRGKYLGCILRLGAHLGCHGSLLLVYLSVVCVIPPDLFIPSAPLHRLAKCVFVRPASTIVHTLQGYMYMLSWLKRTGARCELWAESPSLGVVCDSARAAVRLGGRRRRQRQGRQRRRLRRRRLGRQQWWRRR